MTSPEQVLAWIQTAQDRSRPELERQMAASNVVAAVKAAVADTKTNVAVLNLLPDRSRQ